MKKSIEIAQMIDHTLLKPEASSSMIEKLCLEAIEHRFKSVCVHPYWVKQSVAHLQGSDVLVATVIGFPLGATYLTCKIEECSLALEEGAAEFDMVINIGALKSNKNDFVRQEIESVVAAAQRKTVKVIIETSLLTEQEKRLACRLAKEAGAHFVKTSTGFSSGGATLEDIALMRHEVGGALGVKASGGIRDLKTALAMISQGATRLGTSAGVAIVQEMAASI
jgi:deoxyribose-phosphate aldolase